MFKMKNEQNLISSLNRDHPFMKLLYLSIPLGLLGIFGLSVMITGFVYHYNPEKGMLTRTSPASVAWFGFLLFDYSIIAVLSVFPSIGIYFWMRSIISKIMFSVLSGIISLSFLMAFICFFA